MNSKIKILDQVVTQARDNNVAHLTVNWHKLSDEPILELNNKQVINFTSCSYLGLEHHPDLKQAVIDAVSLFGTQYSSSRAFSCLNLYDKLEGLLSKIFSAHTLVTPSTSMGHQAALPVLTKESDIVLIDKHVHASVQQAAMLLQAKGVSTTLIQHNELEGLEHYLKSAQHKQRVWYLLDGVYSMYGNFAPIKKLAKLVNKYKNLYLYIDDAHGMSWTGVNGKGYILSQIEQHKRMVIATSLNKAFACAGGVLIFKDAKLRELVKNCGAPLIFSGAIQPPMLGAAIASAKLHLSETLVERQQKLAENIDYCNEQLRNKDLPLVTNNSTPIFFIATGEPKTAYNLVKKLYAQDIFVNPGVYPAVPLKKGGIRFTITARHSFYHIDKLINALDLNFSKALQEENVSYQQMLKEFGELQ